MALERILQEEMFRRLRVALLQRSRTYDTAYGLIPDLFNAIAEILSEQNNDRILLLANLLTLETPEDLLDADLERRVLSEGLTRPAASPSFATVVFEREQQLASGEVIRIPRGYPIATAPGDDGTSTTFLTLEDIYATFNNNVLLGELDEVSNATVYRVRVRAVSLTTGVNSAVGPNRITRPLRPLSGCARVFNEESATGAREGYTNTELAELYTLALSGRQLATPNGAQFHVQNSYSNVDDVNVAYGADPLIQRAGSDAGAVDVFVLGEVQANGSDTLFYLGPSQLHPIALAPLVSVTQVFLNPNTTPLVEGTDYEVYRDSSGYGGSVQARDGIRFLAGAAALSGASVGTSTVTINYVYNDLIRTLQAEDEKPELHVLGADKLYRQAVTVDLFMAARLVSTSGFDFNAVRTLVQAQVETFFNELELGDDAEISDIQQRVRQLSGVDNFVVTRLVRDADIAGVSDIVIAGNEKARLLTANLIIFT